MLEQMRRTLPTILKIFLPPLLVLIAFAVISSITGIKMIIFLRDAKHFTDMSIYVGVLSNLGAFMWCAAAAVSLFSFYATAPSRDNRDMRLFVLWSGIFSLFMLFDDFFLFHEGILPNDIIPLILGSPLQQETLLYLYPVVAIAYAARFARTILKTEYLLFLAAVGLLALSLLMDFLQGNNDNTSFYARYEDWPKFMGIAGWLGYHCRTGLGAIRDSREAGAVSAAGFKKKKKKKK